VHQLLAPTGELSRLPASSVSVLTGHTFFPQLISGPFHHGLVIVFSVADEGPGIPAEKHERIFEKFYRSDVQMEGGVGGAGLGLYIARELVRRMGGRLWVESATGGGSLFSFELPSLPT